MPAADATNTARPTAAESWLEEHGDCLYAYALTRVRSRDLAEELVQETLLAAIAGQQTFAGRSTERTWLVGILKNKILQHYRKVAQEPASLEAELPSAAIDAQFGRSGKWRKSPAAWGQRPDRVTENEEFREVVRRCVSKLPGRLAESFLLAERHDSDAQGLAESLGVSANHLYVILYRARTALRRCLERHWFGTAAEGKC